MAERIPHKPGGDQLDRALLEAFVPLLRETVIPSTIIAHLMALIPQDEVNKILADERSGGPAVAMQRLLAVLQECRQPGWFQALLDALENSRYEHIRDIIKGRQTGCDMTFFRRLLAVCAPNLQRIVAVDMLPHLCCLTDDDKVLVQNEARNHGNSRAVVTLLDRVSRREPGWFQQFLSGLRQTGFGDIADQLDDLSSVPEAVPVSSVETSRSFAEVSGTVTGGAVLTDAEGGYQSLPVRPVSLDLRRETEENTTHRRQVPVHEPEPSSPSSPEDAAPWKATLSDLASQLFGQVGLGGTVGQVCVFGRTIHYSTRGAFSRGLKWKFYGEARDQDSGRSFQDPEGWNNQSTAIRKAAGGVLKILMAEGIIEYREINEEDFGKLD
ncbi:DDX58 [Branchiostoma lanceolatum]|uniref:DDX58 protein n=1 Tax=Branchiostoma lanceolatum TaxID=7740 RepID=A0A8J9ZWC1_BRALA|nr:DDX58 [Branchiostoma lanceolatum]